MFTITRQTAEECQEASWLSGGRPRKRTRSHEDANRAECRHAGNRFQTLVEDFQNAGSEGSRSVASPAADHHPVWHSLVVVLSAGLVVRLATSVRGTGCQTASRKRSFKKEWLDKEAAGRESRGIPEATGRNQSFFRRAAEAVAQCLGDGVAAGRHQPGGTWPRACSSNLFKPGGEVAKDFYAELPITIKVTGSYHDFGAFTGDIAKLPRIVTLNDIDVSPGKEGWLDDVGGREDLPLSGRGGSRPSEEGKGGRRQGKGGGQIACDPHRACSLCRPSAGGCGGRRASGSQAMDGRRQQGYAWPRTADSGDQGLPDRLLRCWRSAGSIQSGQGGAGKARGGGGIAAGLRSTAGAAGGLSRWKVSRWSVLSGKNGLACLDSGGWHGSPGQGRAITWGRISASLPSITEAEVRIKELVQDPTGQTADWVERHATLQLQEAAEPQKETKEMKPRTFWRYWP